MPVITGFDFLPDDYAEEPDVVEEALSVYFALPRKGTSVTAMILLREKKPLLFSAGDGATTRSALPGFWAIGAHFAAPEMGSDGREVRVIGGVLL